MQQAPFRPVVDDSESIDVKLNVAVVAGDADGVRRALLQGANPNASIAFIHSLTSETALVRAAQLEDGTGIAELLLAAGASIGARSGDGYETSLLGIAAGTGNVELCRLLVAKGASIDEFAQEEMTALHVAANNGHTDVCRFLVGAGADLHALAGEDTPLHKAGQNNHLECCKVLVELGASSSYVPEDRDEFYLTPFQRTVRYGMVRTAAFFVEECGEDPWQETASQVPVLELPLDNRTKAAMRLSLVVMQAERGIHGSVGEAGDGDDQLKSRRSPGMSPI
jgi:hypothetical protein